MKEPTRTLNRQPSSRHVLLPPGVFFQEDNLFKLGKNLTKALSSEPGSQEALPPEMVEEIAILSGADWSVCLERYVDLPR